MSGNYNDYLAKADATRKIYEDIRPPERLAQMRRLIDGLETDLARHRQTREANPDPVMAAFKSDTFAEVLESAQAALRRLAGFYDYHEAPEANEEP